MRKIMFAHKRALGDALMMTAGLRDFCLLFPDIAINVDTNFPELWENNPYLDRTVTKDDAEYYRVGYPTINNCNNSNIHFTQSFLLDMLAIADLHEPLNLGIGEFASAFANGRVGDPDLGKEEEVEPFTSIRNKYDKFCKTFSRQWPDIHMTDEEKRHNIIKQSYGHEKYWVIAPGGKSDCTCKIWDWRRFQDIINHFDGRIKFVVIGKSDHIVEPLKNVIDLTDKFNSDIRGLFSLVYNAEGCVTGVSFLMHLAAAMEPRKNRERKPCVGIYGGRENTSFTAYCNHQILHTNGTFTCCDAGGCWQSRIIPLPKKEDGNKRLCHHTVKVDDRTIQECMDVITTEDVIRAIEKYYDGNIYTYTKSVTRAKKKMKPKISADTVVSANVERLHEKEINVLASLSSKGGGEQSACHIVRLLRDDGWTVHFHPWDKVYDDYRDFGVSEHSFKRGMKTHMKSGIPLLFYANDQIGDFCNEAQSIVKKSSSVIIGINYINSALPRCAWLSESGKLSAVIFQNEEKCNEFERDRIGFEDTEQIVLFGAIDLNKYLEVHTKKRKDKEPMVVLKHCTADWRKYVTEKSAKTGDKIHLWQKYFYKEPDTQFYSRLLKDTKNIRFEFMEAHEELVRFFKNEPRMVFHRWNSMPVDKFLSRGHVYLYRSSNAWRDMFPRTIAEALAAGLPILSEPRDGSKDRIEHGITGFYCTHYDEYLLNLKTLYRKENMRYAMADTSKQWARKNLDPRRWVEIIEEIT